MEKRCAALAVLLLASLLLLTTAQDETDNILLPSQGKGVDAGKACCDACACTKSIPPQCRCHDRLIGGCHSNCNHCICTKSIPPQCHCSDVKSYCDPPCEVNA